MYAFSCRTFCHSSYKYQVILPALTFFIIFSMFGSYISHDKLLVAVLPFGRKMQQFIQIQEYTRLNKNLQMLFLFVHVLFSSFSFMFNFTSWGYTSQSLHSSLPFVARIKFSLLSILPSLGSAFSQARSVRYLQLSFVAFVS